MPTSEAQDGSAPSDPPRGPSPAARTLVRFAALWLIGALLFVFHGISLHLTPWSQAIVNGIVKFGYPPRGQADTTVVLFTEENLRNLKESYPVPYERHAEVLEALAAYGPKSVLIDFAFVDERPGGVDRLLEAICALDKAGTAVYLAGPPPVKTGNTALEVRSAFLEKGCARPVSAQMDSAHGVSGVLTYGNGFPATKFLPTPAFAMAAGSVGAPDKQEPMEIIWGNGVHPVNERWMGCESEGPWRHLWHILRRDPLSVKLKCPYTRTISVVQLLDSSSDKDVVEALHGKAVFYGASFQMVGDRVSSPVYDELPGVYLHAMAYDNLVTFGRNYKRARHELFLGSLSMVVNCLLLVLTVLLLLWVERPPAAVTRVLGWVSRVGRKVKRPAFIGLGLAVAAAGGLSGLRPSALLLIPIFLGAAAVLHLLTAAPRRLGSAKQFLAMRALALSVLVAVLLLFVAVDGRLGLEAALLLVALPGYFAYKVLVAQDVLFVATTVLLVTASVLSFLPPINLGPRNIVAYVVFFEVARHLMAYADHLAAEYWELRKAHPEAGEWGVRQRTIDALDWLFTVCRRDEREETSHAVVDGAAGRDRDGRAGDGVQRGGGGREALRGDGDGAAHEQRAALRLRRRQDQEERVR